MFLLINPTVGGGGVMFLLINPTARTGWVPLCMDCVSHTEDEEVEDTDGGTCRFLLFRR